MVYVVGHISGGNFSPAVSLGLWAGGRFAGKDLLMYIIVQVLGAILASAVIYFVANGRAGFELGTGSLASNGYGEHSPGGCSYMAALVTEVVMTFIFLFVILGATDAKAPKGFAGIAIGLTLTLIHLISIPVTNTSVNPARSTGPAIFEGGVALSQLWFFWVMPVIGAILAGVVYKGILGNGKQE